MPLILILAVVIIAVMYYRFRTNRLGRDCRWRQDRARGKYVCAFCGAQIDWRGGDPPNVCLRGDQEADR